MSVGRFFVPAHISAGFIAPLVGYTSSAAIIFQAANSTGANDAMITSWFWALGLGMGLSTIGLSLFFKQPILTAWSTPGAAILVTSLAGVPMAEAIGAFLLCSVLLTLVGLSGWFDRLMAFMPQSIAAAMLAGVLLPFAMHMIMSLESQLALVLTMIMTFFISRVFWPKLAIMVTFLMGIMIAWVQNLIVWQSLSLQISSPIWTTPEWSLSATIGVAIPLFIVTMASQNLPGIVVLRSHGYDAPAAPLITWTGITGLLMAPFGGFAFNLSAIMAAICMGKDVDTDPQQRYRSAVWAGLFIVATGIFADSLTGLFNSLPQALVVSIAGLALLGTISSSLSTALVRESERIPAMITLITTASGVALWGIGSAFWGLVIGVSALLIQHYSTNSSPSVEP
ncbi:benzoate/H(+) symporter BenE family transporter [Oceanospirillaceae bacterium]|jgi:benzoate membrane transport protein|nr:benzoate/H(+) symporter BenE family transporter [Oceanospirillaceae bacterium]MBT6101030.1 benzoate/H(+) symporter BenE family transporter [Oceanospirillaceae bacterium]MDB9906058.1 benzoate/H(+) symporter BenE family transporter [Oceanospirillaceae bacterium]MDC1351327.1 benzoate/H(+) symporter BenE family transporter [Oceanospirillaceae bacterium]MDC1507176.1 benzoate/H(+) symporter BenE family transporter [Oceanospirillaceae bacterium]